jgi:hypothetical protein
VPDFSKLPVFSDLPLISTPEFSGTYSSCMSEFSDASILLQFSMLPMPEFSGNFWVFRRFTPYIRRTFPAHTHFSSFQAGISRQFMDFPAVLSPSIMEISGGKSFPIPVLSGLCNPVPFYLSRNFPAYRCKFRQAYDFIIRFENFYQFCLYLSLPLFDI